MNKKSFILFVVITVLVVLLPKNTSANIQIPSTDINVVYDQQNIPDSSFSAAILSCISQEDIQNDSEYVKILTPQLKISEYDSSGNCYWHPVVVPFGGLCDKSQCNFATYFYESAKLAVFIPSLNKVFITNAISSTNIQSSYRAELFPDGSSRILEITSDLKNKTPSFMVKFLLIISTILILKLLISLIFIARTKISKKVLVYVFIVNIISLPIIWFLSLLFGLSLFIIFVSSLIIIMFLESFFIYRLGKQSLSYKQSLLLSLLNGSASLFIYFLYVLYLKIIYYGS